ncbi:hypothetical protein [Methylobacter sp. sgz302048]|uniref:hypothetical protein n=1 Tax=Methylobacter sp. sgz302048 TaxID=3455945 RepID=UPI003FA182B0
MKSKLMKTLAAGVLLTATGFASAEPVTLTDAQMDNVSAGALLGLDALVGSTLTLVDGLLGSVVGAVDALLPAVNLQLATSVSLGLGLQVSL